MRSRFFGTALRLTLVYFLLAGLWILFSDRLLAHWATGSEQLTRLQTYKGWGFVAVTGLGLYVLLSWRERAEEQLRYQASLPTNVSDAIISTDQQFRIVSWNRAAETMLGWSADEAIGKRVSEVTTMDYVDTEAETVLAEFQSHGSWSGEVIQRRKDGALIYAQSSVTAIIGNAGKTIGAVAVNRDITQRKRAEQALHESEERYRVLVEQSPDMIGVMDEQGLVYVNQSGVRLLGAEQLEQLLGKNAEDLVHPDDRGAIRARMRRIAEKDAPNPLVEFRLIRLDGTAVQVESVSMPIVYQGKPVTQFIARDITQRKQAEDALRESEDKFRYVFDHSVVGKSIVSSSGEMHVNKSFCEMLGYSAEELHDKKWQDITHPDDIELSQRELDTLQSGKKEAVRFAKRYLKKDGSILWADASTSLRRDEQGKPLYFMTTVVDITERKQADEKLRESEEKFKKAFYTSPDSININRLADGMYVSINNGFTRIMGYSEADVIGKTSVEMDIWDNPEDRRALVAGLKKNGEVRDLEARFRARNGKIIDGLMSAALIDLNGTPHIISMTRDITQRRQAEQALLKSRNNYQRLFDRANDVILIFEPEQEIILEANAAACAAYGFDHDELVGMSLRALTKNVGAGAAHIKDFLEGRPQDNFESIHVNKAGEAIHFLINCSLIEYQGEKAILSINRDITERKRMELLQDAVYRIGSAGLTTGSLDDLYAEIHRIISGVMDAQNFYITIYDAERDLLTFPYFKDAADAAYMNEARPEKGLTAYVLRTGKSLLCTQAVHDELERRGEVKLLGAPSSIWLGVPLIVRGKAIGAMVVQNYSNPAAYTEREQHMLEFVSAQVAVAIDRKRAEQALRERETRYRALFEDSPVSLWEEDFSAVKRRLDALRQDGITNFEEYFAAHPDAVSECAALVKVLDVNKATMTLQGANRKEDLLKGIAGALEGAALQNFADELVRIAAGETSFNWNGLNRTLDGRLIDVSVNWSAAPGHEESLARVMVSMLDITELKRAEAERQAMAEIMQAAALISNLQGFLGVMRESLARVLYAENFFVIFRNPDSGLFEEVFSVDKYDEPMPPSSLEKSITSYVFRTAEPLLLTDANFADLMARGDVELVGRNSASWLGAPLKTPAGTIGVIAVQNYEDVNCYSERDKVFLASVGAQVALAIERKQAEEKLEEERILLRTLIDSLPDRVYVMDQQGRTIISNTADWKAAGAKAMEEVIGKTDLETYPPELAVQYWAVDQTVISSGTAVLNHEERGTDPSGNPTWLLTSKVPLRDAQGKVRGLVGIGRDITAHKSAEARIERQVHRLSALRAIDAAISSSFDLRLSLNILLAQSINELGVDAGAVLVLNKFSNELEYAAGVGFRGGGITGLNLKLGEGLAGQAILQRRTVSVPNLAEVAQPFSRPRLMSLMAEEEFAAFFIVPLLAKGEVKGVMEVFHRARLDPEPEWLDFLETLAGQAAIAIDSAQTFSELQHSNLDLALAYDATIEGWSRAMDLRDKETEGHTQRVTESAVKLGRAMGLPEPELTQVRRGSLLHDIGKMGVPDMVLLKPGPLTEEEWVIMRRHPTFAYEMLSPIRYLQPAISIPYCHHEKWDGTGYPRGLKGEQIPLAARMFAVVDVFDALTSDRPYRTAWSTEKAREYLREQAGIHFDPQIVELFLKEAAEGE